MLFKAVVICFSLAWFLTADLTAQSKRSDLSLPERGYGPDRLVDRTNDVREARRVSGPILGVLFDGQVGLRSLLGVPGAAVWGGIIPLPEIAEVVVSVERRYALAISGDNRRVVLIRNLSGPETVSHVDETSGVDRILLSPTGAVAGWLLQAGVALFHSTHSQDRELEADEFGARLAAASAAA
ncbi:MAG: hypothetical protein GY953_35685, partial [bacterium]|nr:hypothetical protein [bacterium]